MNDVNIFFFLIEVVKFGSLEVCLHCILVLKKYLFHQQGTEVPGDKNTGTVEGLTEGKEYEFRVFAQNKAGPSDPSIVSPAVKTKARKGL